MLLHAHFQRGLRAALASPQPVPWRDPDRCAINHHAQGRKQTRNRVYANASVYTPPTFRPLDFLLPSLPFPPSSSPIPFFTRFPLKPDKRAMTASEVDRHMHDRWNKVLNYLVDPWSSAEVCAKLRDTSDWDTSGLLLVEN